MKRPGATMGSSTFAARYIAGEMNSGLRDCRQDAVSTVQRGGSWEYKERVWDVEITISGLVDFLVRDQQSMEQKP